MLRRTLVATTAGLVIGFAPGFRASQTPQLPTSPTPPASLWLSANDAWNAGHYPDALTNLQALMKSPAAAEYFDRVALLTGELFTTTELTTDGRAPEISANGAYATYASGPTADPIVHLVKLSSGAQQVAELKTSSLAFDPTGAKLAWLRLAQGAAPPTSEIVVRDLASGADRVVAGAGMAKTIEGWTGDGQSVVFVGVDAADGTRSDVYSARDGAQPVKLTDAPGLKANVMFAPSGAAVIYTEGRGGGGGGRAGGGGGAGGGAGTAFTVHDVKSNTNRTVTAAGATALALSADGSTIAWISRAGDAYSLQRAATLSADQPQMVRTGAQRLEAPALSPSGKLVAYQMMSGIGSSTDWEIYVSDQAGAHKRLTRDIQHDLLPRFLTEDTLIGMMGEARHRRSQLYDVATGARTRLFSNNTIRTISPEYVWIPSADGKHLIVQAERDGDTVSTERGIYVIDLTKKISTANLNARLTQQAANENDLRQRMTTAYAPIAAQIRKTVAGISATRAYEYEKAQFDFDSKHATQPGNAKAIDYLNKTYASFGYVPELQWFTPAARGGGGGNRGGGGGAGATGAAGAAGAATPPAAAPAAPPAQRTANIVSILRGTENPDLIYVVSSHFDSVAIGPGADDDTSGTCALLETARALSKTPLPSTVVFASFTGEESGLLGSREFVRLAGERKWNIVGALNNDMIGWAGESARMDNTIRYSNAGIRDIQHGASFLFTDLILYDAKYYKSTDAAAFYDGWGDIVGGIGSYPVLANPNYHQTTDLIETINFKQVAETAKVTTATIMYLASSPSRLKDLKAAKTAAGVEVTWTPSPEKGVVSYTVAYGPANDPLRTKRVVTTAKAVLPALPAGTQIAVKAMNSKGLEGWDWARVVLDK